MAEQHVGVLAHQMADVEEGAGDPIEVQYGNPTSSFLWRSVILTRFPWGAASLVT